MRQNSALKLFYGDLVQSGDLTPSERVSLAIILSKDAPDTWHVDIDPKTNKASITWTEAGSKMG